jgi:diguanylate cyclase (GGDEF)-like protein/PAS domain S-box-containing protein
MTEPTADVLIVDDNPIDRLRAGRLVDRDARCRALHAEDGNQALAVIASRPVAAVLTDLQMEGMDGLTLVRAIRKEHPQIPVILMTGHGSEEVAMEALRVGATDYVPKHRLARELPPILARTLWTARSGDRRRRCLQALVRRETEFELGNDPGMLAPLLEFLQDEMARIDRWDSAELMRVTIALDEALRNALFHGNLEVSSELRREEDRRFHELAHQRAAIAPYRDRRIRIRISHDPDQSRFVISDDGPGFDTARADRAIEPEDLLSPGGRGLLLMKSFMDSVSFNRAGNEVTLLKKRIGEGSLPPLMGPAGLDGARGPGPGLIRPPMAPTATDAPAAAPGLREVGPRASRSASDGPQLVPPGLHKRLLDQLHDAVYFADTERRILYWNEAAERLTGYSRDEMIGRSCFDGLLDHVDPTGCQLCHRDCPLVHSMAHGRPVSERLFLRHKDGRRISVEVRVMPVRDDDGSVIGGVELFRDVTSAVVVETAYRQTREEADRDPLTGLANRRYLDRMLAHCLEELGRSGHPLCLIMADLDHFKQVNDTWGHPVGDRALIGFAATIQNQCRSIDLVARYGGEEFVVLLPGHRLQTAAQIAERLRTSVARATPAELGRRVLTASFGVAEAAPGETAPLVLERVDAALYRAKSRGRDRVEVDGDDTT